MYIFKYKYKYRYKYTYKMLGPLLALLDPLSKTQDSKLYGYKNYEHDDHPEEYLNGRNHINNRNRPFSASDRGLGGLLSTTHGNQLLRFKIKLSPGLGGGTTANTSHRGEYIYLYISCVFIYVIYVHLYVIYVHLYI
jgi:hypothetical protein